MVVPKVNVNLRFFPDTHNLKAFDTATRDG
jgi:hypothetical protein